MSLIIEDRGNMYVIKKDYCDNKKSRKFLSNK